MRTTLDIDDDVLSAAKDLARKALDASPAGPARDVKPLHGFRPFPRRRGIVTNELIDRLGEEDGSTKTEAHV